MTLQKKSNIEAQERLKAITENNKNLKVKNRSDKTKRIDGIMSSIANLLGYNTPSEMACGVVATYVINVFVETGRVITDKVFGGGSELNRILFEKDDNVKNYKDTDSVKNSTSERSRNNDTTHDSPREHDVKGHGQHYNTKEGPVWKEKSHINMGKSMKVCKNN